MNSPAESASSFDRRRMLAMLAGAGVGSVVFHRAVAAAAEQGNVTPEMIDQAAWVAGLELTDDERRQTASTVQRAVREMEAMRAIDIGYDVPPAVAFSPAPGEACASEAPSRNILPKESAAPTRPGKSDDLAFLPVTELGALLRTRQVSSVELTKLYLDRLDRFDPALHCVVTLTPEIALKQAQRADREIAAGRYRGPLHGVPWGAKDLIAYPGYPTTWGAAPFTSQTFEKKATVAKRLEEAGAVLTAKLSLGALAWGDRWFGGTTRNPWNPAQGSSGSSAGSASATVAGLVGFTLGSETLGSIVSPCRRCGSTGLRPTFGRVSRHGCMSLAWSMDKVGPIARSVEDCALIFGAIHGRDGLDGTAVDRPFSWPPRRDLRTFTVGYLETDKAAEDRAELQVLRDLGVKLVPMKLPDQFPVWALTIILNVEAATVFDELTRQHVNEGIGPWPNAFRQGQFVPAVEYLRANRIRTLLMQEMKKSMAGVDAYVDIASADLTTTNLTGHPSVVLPNGFNTNGDLRTPHSIVFTGGLYQETDLLTLAHAYQQATEHHLERPPMDRLEPSPPEPERD